jgi:hypothetical protein
MRSIIFRYIVAATAALTAACNSFDSVAPPPSSASARRTAFADAAGSAPIMQTVNRYVWFSCGNGGAGETIHVTGELRYSVQRTQDASGVYHLSINSNTAGLTGIGLTSGTFFRGLMTERVNSRAEDILNEDVRTADIIRLVAPGSSESYSLMVTSHFIVDQGTYVLWDQTWNEVC